MEQGGERRRLEREMIENKKKGEEISRKKRRLNGEDKGLRKNSEVLESKKRL